MRTMYFNNNNKKVNYITLLHTYVLSSSILYCSLVYLVGPDEKL